MALSFVEFPNEETGILDETSEFITGQAASDAANDFIGYDVFAPSEPTNLDRLFINQERERLEELSDRANRIIPGVYNDLAPNLIRGTNVIAEPITLPDSQQQVVLTAEAKQYGVRAAISKRSRSDYRRVSYIYLDRASAESVKKNIERLNPIEARQEFLDVFNLSSAEENSIAYDKGPFDFGELSALASAFDASKNRYNAFDGYTGDTTGAASGAFVKFLLTDVRENFQELSQVVTLLQDNYIPYFYGSAPITITISGVLINSVNDQWKYWFLLMYHKLIKGTRLAELPEAPSMSLWYEDTRIAGYPLNLNISHSVSDDTALPFSMDILVKEYSVEKAEEEQLYESVFSNQSFRKETRFVASVEEEEIVAQGFFEELAGDVTDAAYEAAEEVITDAAEDAIEASGIDQVVNQVSEGIQNFSPDKFAQDPVGTIRNAPSNIQNTKAGLSEAVNNVTRAKPSVIADSTVRNNVILTTRDNA
jgi:hypothetical protein